MIKVIKDLCPQNHRCPLLGMCPENAISQKGNSAPKIDQDRCAGCGICVSACAFGAVRSSD